MSSAADLVPSVAEDEKAELLQCEVFSVIGVTNGALGVLLYDFAFRRVGTRA